MDLPERRAVELRYELRQGNADQRLAVAGDDAGVLVRRLEIEDVVDRDLAHELALGGADPAQPPRGGRQRARDPGEDVVERRRLLLGGQLALQALDRAREPL